jgi:hypothetical protein
MNNEDFAKTLMDTWEQQQENGSSGVAVDDDFQSEVSSAVGNVQGGGSPDSSAEIPVHIPVHIPIVQAANVQGGESLDSEHTSTLAYSDGVHRTLPGKT